MGSWVHGFMGFYPADPDNCRERTGMGSWVFYPAECNEDGLGSWFVQGLLR